MREKYDVIIVGSGAAGFSTADWLFSYGVTDICIVSENVNYGTSRNAGSDKQTYYKLDLCSESGDSVSKMALDFVKGGSMNGSDALVEAANSTRCFMRLCEMGVPFPADRFGRYVGYQTDHDSTQRATSAGPLTSKFMTEKLEEKVRRTGIEILDGFQVIKLIEKNKVVSGVICNTKNGLKVIRSKTVILCTGAPADIYSRSVYPECQTGATGLAIEVGAELSNFQEWQYGIASIKFRWNLSGSYQQVVPRYYSVTPDGREEEFLLRNSDANDIYSKVFLKGYQWPFDSAKINGSSLIDILVFKELEKGNRVYIDFTKNGYGYSFDCLSNEAKEYINNAECNADTPIERLQKLNPKAIKLYASHDIDLWNEPLEIGICAQHNNGGIRTDINSESSVKNLFAVGEAAGKFGVYRPGGSALNDTQVGGLCAAKYISSIIDEIVISDIDIDLPSQPLFAENGALKKLKNDLQLKMSDCAAIYRDYEKLKDLLSELEGINEKYYETVTVSDEKQLGEFYSFKLTLLSMISLCRTQIDSIRNIGSRGGCICFINGNPIEENILMRQFVTVTTNEKVSYVQCDEIPNEKVVFETLLKSM